MHLPLQGHVGVFQKLVDLLNSSTAKSLQGERHLHPLDPLVSDEVVIAAKVCKEHAKKQGISPLRFNAITLQVTLSHTINRFQAVGTSFCRNKVGIEQLWPTMRR
jgi:Cu2+-containing amine oxidase